MTAHSIAPRATGGPLHAAQARLAVGRSRRFHAVDAPAPATVPPAGFPR